MKTETETLTEAVNIDALLEQAKIFISLEEVDREIEWRVTKTKDCKNGLTFVFHPNGEAFRLKEPALTILGSEQLRSDVLDYIALETVEQVYDSSFDLPALLELRCRKEESSLRVTHTLADVWDLNLRTADTGVAHLMLDQAEPEGYGAISRRPDEREYEPVNL